MDALLASLSADLFARGDVASVRLVLGPAVERPKACVTILLPVAGEGAGEGPPPFSGLTAREATRRLIRAMVPPFNALPRSLGAARMWLLLEVAPVGKRASLNGPVGGGATTPGDAEPDAGEDDAPDAPPGFLPRRHFAAMDAADEEEGPLDDAPQAMAAFSREDGGDGMEDEGAAAVSGEEGEEEEGRRPVRRLPRARRRPRVAPFALTIDLTEGRGEGRGDGGGVVWLQSTSVLRGLG